MSASWKTVRVFISSTITDMQAERDHLVRFVFPKLREELIPFRIHLIDVDLRWGVTSDQDQDALGIVREVIDECRPYFLCILGGRYGWVPPGMEESTTASDIRYAVLAREPNQRGFPLFYFRDPEATAAIEEPTSGQFREPPGNAGEARLAALKNVVIETGLPVFVYPAQWDAAQRRLTGLEVFGDRVRADLLGCFKADPGLVTRCTGEGTVLLDEFSDEAEQMEAFIEEHTDRYVIGSREPLLRETLAFATGDGSPNVLVLTGDPGSGKSAFLAKLTRDLASRHPSCFLFPTFIGASTGSSDLPRTLRRLCHELAHATGSTEPLPFDIKGLVTRFQKLLAEAASRRRVILVFDALDQFDATDGAHWLNWLPRELPPDVRLIASVVASADGQPEHQTLAILRTHPSTHVVKLEPLTEADTLAIIERYLRRYSKRLSPEQLAALLAKPAGRLPLYVLTALEELRTLGTYEEITERIRALPGDARALFGWILTQRLACDPGFRDREGRPCGAALFERSGACLVTSRRGLSPAELTKLLDPGDPLGNVAALLRVLRPYLTWRGGRLNFRLAEFRAPVEAAYLDTSERQRAAHSVLANCFLMFADPNGDESWVGADQVPFTELPYHLEKADEFERWTQVVTSFSYLNAVVARVGLNSERTQEGAAVLYHDGYYIVRDELDSWLRAHSRLEYGRDLIESLFQVWKQHEFEFVMSGKSVMDTLYHDLKAMQPKQVFDRASRKLIPIHEGPLSIWCERERQKHENADSPWIVVIPPEPSQTPDPSQAESGYIFISYKREDLPRIVAFMHRIVALGYPIWFDRGIPGGAEWDALIEEKVSNCLILLVFLSQSAVESKWVRREIKFADSENRPILGIRLDENLELKHGLKVVMNQYQMIDASNADFSDELRKAIEYVRLL